MIFNLIYKYVAHICEVEVIMMFENGCRNKAHKTAVYIFRDF